MSSIDASTASVRIGPVVVQCDGDPRALAWLVSQHSAFLTTDPPDVRLTLSLVEAPLLGPPMPTVERTVAGRTLAYHGWRATVHRGRAEATIFSGPRAALRGPRRVASLVRVLVQTVMSDSGLALHAATLTHEGTGWVFVGARGAGKTTLARRYTTSPRLGDDYALLTCLNRGFQVHGSPYSGREGTPSEPGCQSVSAIVCLRQASYLEAVRLSRADAFRQILAHVIAPDVSPDGLAERLAVLERLVTSVPVLELAFRRDDDIWSVLPQAVAFREQWGTT